jgi:hypothetical protein
MFLELASEQHAETIKFRMTRAVAQIAEAKKRAAECLRANFKGCEKM